MKQITTLMLFAVLLMLAAADGRTMNMNTQNRFGDVFCEAPVKTSWWLFTAENLPEKIPFFTGEKLVLPDGRTISGVPFTFPEEGAYRFPKEMRHAVLVCDFESEKDCTLTAGVGVCWRMRWFCNGEMICDTTDCTNGELPTLAENHICEFQVRKGHNRMMIDATAAFGFEAAFHWFENRKLSFAYGPWIQFPANGEVRISFEASHPSPTGVDYREVGTAEWKRVWDSRGGRIKANTAVHHVTLKGLQAGKKYEYRAVLAEPRRKLEETFSEIHPFSGIPEKSFSFSMTADLQYAHKLPQLLCDAFRLECMKQIDFFAYIGDVYWASDFNQHILKEFVLPYTQYAKDLPLVMIHGNHEMYGRECDRFFDYFAPRQTGEGYFSFTYGETFFLVLDFCDDAGRRPWPSNRSLHDIEAYLEEERLWLKEILETPACRNAKYRIVLAHAVPVGDFKSYIPQNMKNVLDGLLTGKNPVCRIHAWFGGHVHRAFRTIPSSNRLKGVVDPKLPYTNPGTEIPFPVLVVSGPSGANPSDLYYSFFRVDVTPEKMRVRSFDPAGKCFDEIEILPDGAIREIRSSEFFKEYKF